jgi:uncharacterized lipoprotein YehR (DUF1307 family)
MKKSVLTSLLSAILVMVMVFALAGCNSADDKPAETKGTTTATQAQTEKATEATTQAQENTTTETQAPEQQNSNDELVIPTVTGVWAKENNLEGCTIHIGVQSGNTIDVEITSIRGEGAQIATVKETVTVTPDYVGNEIRGYVEFDYTDSFENTGVCKLTVAENVVSLTVEEKVLNGSWGIGNASGDYILKSY